MKPTVLSIFLMTLQMTMTSIITFCKFRKPSPHCLSIPKIWPELMQIYSFVIVVNQRSINLSKTYQAKEQDMLKWWGWASFHFTYDTSLETNIMLTNTRHTTVLKSSGANISHGECSTIQTHGVMVHGWRD